MTPGSHRRGDPQHRPGGTATAGPQTHARERSHAGMPIGDRQAAAAGSAERKQHTGTRGPRRRSSKGTRRSEGEAVYWC